MKRAAWRQRSGRAGALFGALAFSLLGLGACQYLTGKDVVKGTIFDAGPDGSGGSGGGGGGGGSVVPVSYACAWAKDFGEDVDPKVALSVDLTGAVLISGSYRGSINFGGGALAAGDPAARDLYVAKLGGEMGEYKWALGLGDDGSDQLGQAISATSDAIFVAGTYQGLLNPPDECGMASSIPMASDDDIFLLKLSPDGKCVAGATYGATMSKEYMGAMAASETDVMLVAAVADESEMHVVRYGQGLDLKDHCAFVDPIPMMPSVLHMHPKAAAIAAQSLFVTGAFNGTMTPCVKSSSVFNKSFAMSEDAFVGAIGVQNIGGLVDPSLWTLNWGDQNTQRFSAIAADPGGALFMAGAMDGTTVYGNLTLSASPGGKDAWIGQVNLSGVPGWSLRYGNFADQSGEAVAFDAKTNQVAFAGNFQGTIAVGGDTFVNASPNNTIFLAKLRATDGAHLFSHAYGDGMLGGQSVSALQVSPDDGGLVLAGTFSGKLDFGGECMPLVASDPMMKHLFVVKLVPKDPAGSEP